MFSSFAKVYYFFPNEVVSIIFFYAVTQCDQEQLKGARGPLGKEAKLGRQGETRSCMKQKPRREMLLAGLLPWLRQLLPCTGWDWLSRDGFHGVVPRVLLCQLADTPKPHGLSHGPVWSRLVFSRGSPLPRELSL